MKPPGVSRRRTRPPRTPPSLSVHSPGNASPSSTSPACGAASVRAALGPREIGPRPPTRVHTWWAGPRPMPSNGASSDRPHAAIVTRCPWSSLRPVADQGDVEARSSMSECPRRPAIGEASSVDASCRKEARSGAGCRVRRGAAAPRASSGAPCVTRPNSERLWTRNDPATPQQSDESRSSPEWRLCHRAPWMVTPRGEGLVSAPSLRARRAGLRPRALARSWGRLSSWRRPVRRCPVPAAGRPGGEQQRTLPVPDSWGRAALG